MVRPTINLLKLMHRGAACCAPTGRPHFHGIAKMMYPVGRTAAPLPTWLWPLPLWRVDGRDPFYLNRASKPVFGRFLPLDKVGLPGMGLTSDLVHVLFH